MSTARVMVWLAVAAVGASGLAGCGDDNPVTVDDGAPAGEWVTVPFRIGADQYLRNRFFRLDLPAREPFGRSATERIDPSSLKVFRLMPSGTLGPGDLQNMAAYVDSAGVHAWPDLDFTAPHVMGQRWRELWAWDLMWTADGDLFAVDLHAELPPEAVVAVCYDVRDAAGDRVSVGDDPARGAPTQALPGEPGLFYRLKLLKAPADRPDRHVFDYGIRNIYAFGMANIDAQTFTLELAAIDPLLPDPTHATPTIPWIRLFGLDTRDVQGRPGPDGLIDIGDPTLFDLERGLLKFPPDLPEPFAADPARYEALAAPDTYPYPGSYLAAAAMPEIYDFATDPTTYPRYRRFEIRGSYVVWVPAAAEEIYDGRIDLDRTAWMRAAPPVPLTPGDLRTWLPEKRAGHVRWFPPRDRVLARYLIPTLTGAARDETIPALDLYLRDDALWAAETWGGLTTGLSRTGVDLGDFTVLEIWVNDHEPDPARRSGRLHVDLGRVSEDGFWPRSEGTLVTGTRELEDANGDGVWTSAEDIGLDGLGVDGPERFDAAYEIAGDTPYPRINGTAGNNREDDEDVNGDWILNLDNAYFTAVLDLATSTPDIDVVQDYADVQELVDAHIAWRRYRILLSDMEPVAADLEPDWSRVTHLRVWFEDEARLPTDNEVHVQLGAIRFLD